jgi:PTH1 family peptidyl-tRNA hydrolase
MKIVVGFGNPGRQYNFTRHNFGFLALDFYAKLAELKWQEEPKFLATIARDGDTLLVKPQTFYNEVGQSIARLVQYYKVDVHEDLLVVADDFDLSFGITRFRQRGSAGGNNGLKSTILHLGREDFPRLRLGTGNAELRKKLGDVEFVLSKFTPEEQEELPQILKNVVKLIKNPPK